MTRLRRQMLEELERRNYSANTVRAYIRTVEDLARYFKRRPGVVSRRVLLKEVWEMSKVDEVETRTVDMHIAKLRKKLDPDGRLILTVRGAGYRYLG